MRIIVNGQEHVVAQPVTVGQLLAKLDVTVAHVAVELNQSLLPRADHNATKLTDGNNLEVVTLVGGE